MNETNAPKYINEVWISEKVFNDGNSIISITENDDIE